MRDIRLVPTDVTDPSTGEPLYVHARRYPRWERWWDQLWLTLSLISLGRGDDYRIGPILAGRVAWGLTSRQWVPCEPEEKNT